MGGVGCGSHDSTFGAGWRLANWGHDHLICMSCAQHNRRDGIPPPPLACARSDSKPTHHTFVGKCSSLEQRRRRNDGGGASQQHRATSHLLLPARRSTRRLRAHAHLPACAATRDSNATHARLLLRRLMLRAGAQRGRRDGCHVFVDCNSLADGAREAIDHAQHRLKLITNARGLTIAVCAGEARAQDTKNKTRKTKR